MMNADQFAAALICEGYADTTVRVYRCMFQRWTDYAITYGRAPLAPDPVAVRAWSSGLPAGISTRGQARATIKHLCRIMDVEDVSRAIRLPRAPRLPRSRALTDTQARQLARTADLCGLAGLAVLVGLYTGARRGEIASLSWDRIDLPNQLLVLDRTKVSDTHEVPIHPALARRLELRQVPGEQWVFPGRYGGHVAPAVVWEMVRDVAAQAGIGKVTPHMLRHTIVGAVYDIGRDLRAAQDLAGHTDPSITARYTSRTKRQILNALEQIDWLDDSA